MASPGNPNQQPNISDMHKFFNPNLQNPNLTSPPFTLPNSSYPPPSSASYPPPAGPYYAPPQTSPFHHPPPQQQQFHIPPPNLHLHHQRSIPFPTPPLQPPPLQNPNNNPNHGARLMALLSGPQSEIQQQQQSYMPVIAPLQPTSSGGSDISMAQNLQSGQMVNNNVSNTAAAMVQPSPLRMQSSKLPKGRHLVSDHVVYDIDVRHMGEVQPQLEVTPITKYGSDPGLVVGRQIAVNKSYICYGLKLGAIRVLNINTALRSLLKGLAQVSFV